MANECKIAVVGAGVIGLTAALTLQEQSKSPVVIIAADFPGDESINYASPWAGAHGRPAPAVTAQEIQMAQYMQTTHDVLYDLAAAHPGAGIQFMDGYEYLADPPESYTQLRDGIGSAPGFRVLTPSELSHGMKWGCTYRTWSLNSPVYCAFLLRLFILRGGKTMRTPARLQSLAEVPYLAPQADTVVNCSGIGFGDKDVFPTKANVAYGKPFSHYAYGAGGSGYELSWGVAKEVARLALGGEHEGERAQQQPMLKAAL
ncbi:hypothetical protein LTR67_009642 [Exophiala xenobiotica]